MSMSQVPSHELFNSCQLLLDGAATRDDRAFIVLSAMLAAGGEGTLEEMALQRLAEGQDGPKKRWIIRLKSLMGVIK